MTLTLTHRREDGTFIASFKGGGYHIIQSDPLWDAAAALAVEMGDTLPMELPPPPPPPPSTDPMDYPLTALEFDATLVRIGIDRDQVAPAIKTIFADDIDAMADSLARWWNLKTMTRDNPVMELLKPVFSVTDADIDTAWMATVSRR